MGSEQPSIVEMLFSIALILFFPMHLAAMFYVPFGLFSRSKEVGASVISATADLASSFVGGIGFLLYIFAFVRLIAW